MPVSCKYTCVTRIAPLSSTPLHTHPAHPPPHVPPPPVMYQRPARRALTTGSCRAASTPFLFLQSTHLV